jgi:hypothetical protein
VNARTSRTLRTLFALALLVVAGCAQNRHPDEKGDFRPSEETLRRESERTRIEAPPQPPEPAVLPSQGDCAPPADNRLTVSACCNGKACIGQCVAGPAGTVECSCYGVQGGCAQGQVCCRMRRACTAPKDCQVP